MPGLPQPIRAQDIALCTPAHPYPTLHGVDTSSFPRSLSICSKTQPQTTGPVLPNPFELLGLLRPRIEDGSGTNSYRDSTWIRSCSPKFQLADQPVWLLQWLRSLPLWDLLFHLSWMSSGSWHEWVLSVWNNGGHEDSLPNPIRHSWIYLWWLHGHTLLSCLLCVPTQERH